MALFGRKSKNEETGTSPEEAAADIEVTDAADAPERFDDLVSAESQTEVEAAALRLDVAKSAPLDRAENGPLDETEANAVRPYIDLGGIKVLPREGLQLRLEVEEGTQRVVAVGLDFGGSNVQVQPFSAPRSSGLWNATRAEVREQIEAQGGTVEERVGGLGPELLATIPTSAGAATVRRARFVGVDGPRWFLRGVIGGSGVDEPEGREQIDELFRSIVVVRGVQPMPPRDLIPLRVPVAAQADS